MDLMFNDYEQLGGICPKEMYARCKMEAESVLAQLNSSFNIEWNTPESETLAFISLVDEAFNADTIFQNGGQVSSIRIGSYSESRSGGDTTAIGAIGRSKEIVSRFGRVFRKRIGVVRR